MSPMSVVLVDDPTANRQFDLRRTLERRGAWRLKARVVPGNAVAAEESDAAAAIAAASAISAGAPVSSREYGVGAPDAKRMQPLALGAALEALVRQVPPPFATVVFVSFATLPFV